MHKKKLAICLSGMMRQAGTCFENLNENLYKPLSEYFDIDFFISTWSEADKEYIETSKVRSIEELSTKQLLKLYKPKEYNIEPYNDKVRDKIIKILPSELYRRNRKMRPHLQVNNVLAMFYNNYMAGECKRKYEKTQGFKYDYVIRARLDLWMYKSILDKASNIKDKNYIPTYLDIILQDDEYIYAQEIKTRKKLDKYVSKHSQESAHYRAANDMFAMGRNDLMDIYNDCYLNLNKLTLQYNQGIQKNSMAFLHWHLLDKKVPCVYTLPPHTCYYKYIVPVAMAAAGIPQELIKSKKKHFIKICRGMESLELSDVTKVVKASAERFIGKDFNNK
jgi:hypothetical protein